MLVTELPLEITILIASYLKLKDRFQCCLVCKNWAWAFQKSLFEKIVLNNKVYADKLISPASQAIHRLRLYRHTTRKLVIGGNVLLDNQTLYVLQKIFPNLHSFFWNNSRHRLSSQKTDFYGWNLWSKTLTSLEVTLAAHNEDIYTKMLDTIRSKLCRLKRLYFSHKSSKKFEFTFDDFELLNDQLPELTHMTLKVEFKEMSFNELSKVKEVKPRPCLKTLQIHITKSTYEWMYYIAVKYPNVSTIGRLYFGRTLSPNLPTYKTPTRLAELPRPLQQLERIHMVVYSHAVYIYHVFVKQLRGLNIQVKNIWIDVNCSLNFDNTSGIYVQLAAQPWANTLEEISILYNTHYSGHLRSFYFFHYDDYYPRLVHLDIEAFGAIIIINHVLENRPSLKTIKVTCNLLSYEPDLSTPSIKHGLRHLALLSTDVYTNTLTYISTYCNDLKNMTLDRVKILESQNIINSPHCIDMSSTHFKRLRIKHIEFIKQNKGNISVFLFPSSEEMKEKTRYRRKIPTENVWACFQGLDSYRKGLSFEVQKKGEEAEKIEEYFRAFSYMPRRSDTLYEPLELVHRLLLGSWASFLPDGYVIFKYSSVEDLVIGP
ncbi:hypothetical protein PHYBLDRAFT_145664 [Phycomyces blakesleeanus NRRL 1555(-)]|uniref:F-box domain-containing protein n=1 Tax=Phycomyces blakesleeanus (strain ATCC 8743b / DSM 1359 / FGSC 10004 / NBRC 33097 / NRRL 1555) TaxID=763407 RepID=A0A163AG42_PHYB8|nr:hypothetical protein PHYBLDRAFT_145664 [Phycomyces blakesleeanus NRRL 1555(-)]OAD73261.1 hypothetical protein PHYBLDRAFT_145664 [Phycomyces blakesleeanus NRRL 1555(-)]|eukprot:XP_018291301.1 hypothetical protein PHYBLDRAFT_145664 [Phycomyces blakesleeanus NRRL 1555(-)]